MKLHNAAITLLLLTTLHVSNAFTPPSSTLLSSTISSTTRTQLKATIAEALSDAASSSDSLAPALDDISYQTVNKLTFRELQRECKLRGLGAVGSTAVLRRRLLESEGIFVEESSNGESDGVDDVPEVEGITFTDSSDPDFEYKSLLSQISEKCQQGHWKSALRKLKQISKKYGSTHTIPFSTYLEVLESCTENRLQGARAAIPARKIIEEIVDRFEDDEETSLEELLPSAIAAKCITDALGIESGGTHDGHGGIDVALATLAALDRASYRSLPPEPYEALAVALARDGDATESLALLRHLVVERGATPQLSTLAAAAAAAAAAPGFHPEEALQALSLAKAGGYVLDNVAGVPAGRDLLAAGVVAAERMNNLALGLRLLTAAGAAEGCAPDKGDVLVAAQSAAAQRAAVLIHKRAIQKAAVDGNWKLCVKLLELMNQRGLMASTRVWRTVVTTCAKCEKSRRATAILFDWVKLSEQGKTEKPPLSVFNTVLNACEICGEEELTLTVLEAMKKTHDTDGNLITFNIALKRLAKLGQRRACEGIIVAMIESGVEPSVVSYTTAVGACAHEPSDPVLAHEWLQRMKSMGCSPNLYTYNTALAACMDGKLESTVLGSRIATEMLDAVDKEIKANTEGVRADKLKSVIPDTYTKTLARKLMKQLRENWRNGDINMMVAKATVRVPLLKLVDFDRSKAAERVEQQMKEAAALKVESEEDEEEGEELVKDEEEIEYAAVNKLHKEGRRNVEV